MFEPLIQQLAATAWVEWLGMSAGILGVWFSIKEKTFAWALFITCYSCYVYISYQHGLHAFMGMNIVFICISFYGLWKWSRPRDESDAAVAVRPTRRQDWPWVLFLLLAGTFTIGWILASRGVSNLPYFDAFATCCGFVAQWMLSRKQIETWIFWIISDIVYLAIFIKEAAWPSVILFTVFIILAIKGWREWRAILKPAQ